MNYDGRLHGFAGFYLKHGHCPLQAEQKAVVRALPRPRRALYRTTAGRGTHPNHQIYLFNINTAHALAGYEKPAISNQLI